MDIQALFENTPLTIAIGECIAFARETGNETLETSALVEMSEAFDLIASLESAYALEVEAQ